LVDLYAPYGRMPRIEEAHHILDDGTFHTAYRYRAGEGPYILVESYRVGDACEGDKIQVGPFRLRLVYHFAYRGFAWCVWDDWRGVVTMLLERAKIHLQVYKARWQLRRWRSK
jgi:hypothetical protein